MGAPRKQHNNRNHKKNNNNRGGPCHDSQMQQPQWNNGSSMDSFTKFNNVKNQGSKAEHNDWRKKKKDQIVVVAEKDQTKKLIRRTFQGKSKIHIIQSKQNHVPLDLIEAVPSDAWLNSSPNTIKSLYLTEKNNKQQKKDERNQNYG